MPTLNNIADSSLITTQTAQIWKLLAEVCDPEIPVLSVIDLGIIRDVVAEPIPSKNSIQYTIIITPTYSGCPAMDIISIDIKFKLIEHGFKNIKTVTVLSPAWTTDWMSEAGKQKLIAYGIAPPNPKQQVCDNKLFAVAEAIQCPVCKSFHTRLVSQFGSTPCKALYQCKDCEEPFDYFKCH